MTAVVPAAFDKSQCFTLIMSTPKTSVSSEFFAYFLNSIPGVTQFEMQGWGTAQTNISVPIVQNLLVVNPPYDEQIAIVRFLDLETHKLDGLIQSVEKAVICLQEYRTALITAAVTGKIDVREWVPVPEPA